MTHRKILVVDDSATARHYLADLLGSKGYRVITAQDGSEALAKTRAERPDLVLMDVVMPGQSGYQATRELARDPQTCEIPVVICSSKGNESDRVWGLRQGARDYIVKPFRPEDLLARIAGLVA